MATFDVGPRTASGGTAASVLVLLLGAVQCGGCADLRRPAVRSGVAASEVTDADRFLAAFRSEEYAAALAVAEGMLDHNLADTLALVYRAAALSQLARHEEAVESFSLASTASPRGLTDAVAQYLRASSLYHEKLYSRSLQQLDALAASHPHSRLAESAQELAATIQAALAGGASVSNVNWYLQQGTMAQAAARPALAVEYLEEAAALAASAAVEPGDRLAQVRLSLGACYLELARPQDALAHLERVPESLSAHRAGLFRAMALHALGRRDEALRVLDRAASSPDASVALRAAALKRDLIAGQAP